MDDNEIESLLVNILENQTSMDSKIQKNMVMLEQVNAGMKTMAEVLVDFSEQFDAYESRGEKALHEKLDTIQLGVNNMNKLTKIVEGKIDDIAQEVILVEAVSGKNMKDIAHLKLTK